MFKLNLTKDICGLHFRSDEEVVTPVEEWVNEKDPDFFSSELMALEHRWSKCITLKGNYIEKEEVDLIRKYLLTHPRMNQNKYPNRNETKHHLDMY